MSLYNLLSTPHVADLSAYWEKGFSQDEITRIRTLGDSLVGANSIATVGDNNVDADVRRSHVAWLTTENACWLYDKLGFITRQLNGQYFQFDIKGFHEDLQYTVYNSTEKGHYDWHMDGCINNGLPPRKLSLVLQLSDPTEYEGGDLELLHGSQPQTLKKEQGLVYAFPSYVLHHVTPVTKGTRRSLVCWLYGPRFV